MGYEGFIPRVEVGSPMLDLWAFALSLLLFAGFEELVRGSCLVYDV